MHKFFERLGVFSLPLSLAGAAVSLWGLSPALVSVWLSVGVLLFSFAVAIGIVLTSSTVVRLVEEWQLRLLTWVLICSAFAGWFVSRVKDYEHDHTPFVYPVFTCAQPMAPAGYCKMLLDNPMKVAMEDVTIEFSDVTNVTNATKWMQSIQTQYFPVIYQQVMNRTDIIVAADVKATYQLSVRSKDGTALGELIRIDYKRAPPSVYVVDREGRKMMVDSKIVF